MTKAFATKAPLLETAAKDSIKNIIQIFITGIMEFLIAASGIATKMKVSAAKALTSKASCGAVSIGSLSCPFVKGGMPKLIVQFPFFFIT